jgi:hypothetical protein
MTTVPTFRGGRPIPGGSCFASTLIITTTTTT